MADSDVVLRFASNIDSGADMRTFRVLQVPENAAEELELYKVAFCLPTVCLTLKRSSSVLASTNRSLHGHDDLSSQELRYLYIRDGWPGRMVFEFQRYGVVWRGRGKSRLVLCMSAVTNCNF